MPADYMRHHSILPDNGRAVALFQSVRHRDALWNRERLVAFFAVDIKRDLAGAHTLDRARSYVDRYCLAVLIEVPELPVHEPVEQLADAITEVL